VGRPRTRHVSCPELMRSSQRSPVSWSVPGLSVRQRTANRSVRSARLCAGATSFPIATRSRAGVRASGPASPCRARCWCLRWTRLADQVGTAPAVGGMDPMPQPLPLGPHAVPHPGPLRRRACCRLMASSGPSKCCLTRGSAPRWQRPARALLEAAARRPSQAPWAEEPAHGRGQRCRGSSQEPGQRTGRGIPLAVTCTAYPLNTYVQSCEHSYSCRQHAGNAQSETAHARSGENGRSDREGHVPIPRGQIIDRWDRHRPNAKTADRSIVCPPSGSTGVMGNSGAEPWQALHSRLVLSSDANGIGAEGGGLRCRLPRQRRARMAFIGA
jgi:hypothetical protein